MDSPLSVVVGGDFSNRPRQPWLVNGIIREGTVVFLSGPAGTGKSFIGLELAACVAEGRPFFGHGVNQGETLYVAAERGDSQRDRLEALRDLKGYDPNSIHFVTVPVAFNDPQQVEAFHAALDGAALRPKLIIIDTLRASFEGDENSSSVAQEVMNALNRVRKTYGSTIVVLHHVNGFGKSRGSSAFIGAADTELYLTESSSKSQQKVYLTVRKQNNGKKWVKLGLTAKEIDFGDGYTSIVFEQVSTEEADTVPDPDQDVKKVVNVLAIVDEADGPLSLSRMQRELADKEGVLRKKETLKAELRELANEGLIKYTESPSKFVIERV